MFRRFDGGSDKVCSFGRIEMFVKFLTSGKSLSSFCFLLRSDGAGGLGGGVGRLTGGVSAFDLVSMTWTE